MEEGGAIAWVGYLSAGGNESEGKGGRESECGRRKSFEGEGYLSLCATFNNSNLVPSSFIVLLEV